MASPRTAAWLLQLNGLVELAAACALANGARLKIRDIYRDSTCVELEESSAVSPPAKGPGWRSTSRQLARGEALVGCKFRPRRQVRPVRP